MTPCSKAGAASHFLIASLLLVFGASAGSAQRVADLATGSLLRLHMSGTGGAPITATLVRQVSDTIWLKRAGETEPFAVVTTNLRELFVSRGFPKRNLLRSAARGVLGGAAVGSVLGLALALSDREGAEFLGGVLDTTVFFGGLFAVPGLLVGTLVGLNPREKWDGVSLR